MEELQDLSLKPGIFAQKCPVCNGFGTVSNQRRTCHACKGKGYILIKNSVIETDRYGNLRMGEATP